MYKLRFKWDDEIEVGLDEAGRGCLWGPLFVGAVAFSDSLDDFPDGGSKLQDLKDSKQISAKKREELFDYIKESALFYSISTATIAEIDTHNILQADMIAMHRALDALPVPPGRLLIDGDYWKKYKDVEAHTIVDGDATYLAIAAAGILAKVSRDRWVKEQVERQPDLHEKYGFGTNMGYGAAKHIEGLSLHGVTAEHRRSFGPVKRVLGLSTPAKTKGWTGFVEE